MNFVKCEDTGKKKFKVKSYFKVKMDWKRGDGGESKIVNQFALGIAAKILLLRVAMKDCSEKPDPCGNARQKAGQPQNSIF